MRKNHKIFENAIDKLIAYAIISIRVSTRKLRVLRSTFKYIHNKCNKIAKLKIRRYKI